MGRLVVVVGDIGVWSAGSIDLVGTDMRGEPASVALDDVADDTYQVDAYAGLYTLEWWADERTHRIGVEISRGGGHARRSPGQLLRPSARPRARGLRPPHRPALRRFRGTARQRGLPGRRARNRRGRRRGVADAIGWSGVGPPASGQVRGACRRRDPGADAARSQAHALRDPPLANGGGPLAGALPRHDQAAPSGDARRGCGVRDEGESRRDAAPGLRDAGRIRLRASPVRSARLRVGCRPYPGRGGSHHESCARGAQRLDHNRVGTRTDGSRQEARRRRGVRHAWRSRATHAGGGKHHARQGAPRAVPGNRAAPSTREVDDLDLADRLRARRADRVRRRRRSPWCGRGWSGSARGTRGTLRTRAGRGRA